ncbi:MAG: CDP-alcohol phosphatidyltransferase family protein [Deltaproteobacteria bacterium]|nr:CDP-alcohol phosphatidyltransferase family protein [Deltaproteobacteria bacterium]
MCLPFLLYYLSQRQILLSLGVFLSAVLSDFLDGYLARRFSLVSKIGKILDPIVDKTFVVGTFFYFFVSGSVPFWFLGIILFRDFSQLVGFLILWTKKVHFNIKSELIGKLSTGMNFVVILVLILESAHSVTAVNVSLFNLLFIGASFFTVLSLFYYGLVWSSLYRGQVVC